MISWQIAAHEAVMAGYVEIEPLHLALGVLKFAEADTRELGLLMRDEKVAQAVAVDRDELRDDLRTGGIETHEGTRRIRYALRDRQERISKTRVRNDGMIHRSGASRGVFDEAFRLASGFRNCRAVHLWRALGPVLPKDLFPDAHPENGARPRAHGHRKPVDEDAGKPVRTQRDGAPERETENPIVQVLADYLRKPKKHNFVLIRKGDGAPAIGALLDELSRCEEVRIRKLDFQAMVKEALASDLSGSTVTILDQAVHEMFHEELDDGAALYIAGLGECLAPGDRNTPLEGLPDVLKGPLSKKEMNLLIEMEESGYRELVSTDHAWKKILHPVYVHDLQAAHTI